MYKIEADNIVSASAQFMQQFLDADELGGFVCDSRDGRVTLRIERNSEAVAARKRSRLKRVAR
jgi:hypothetical protein